MIPFFPKQISYRAIIVYLLSLVVVCVVYSNYAMRWEFIILGVICVLAFFLLSNIWTQNRRAITDRQYLRFLFLIAVALRLAWVVGSYFYYLDSMGTSFGHEVYDALAYHETAVWLANSPWTTTIN